ncbi:alpha-1,2 mannosyltransferase KTR1 [Ophiocordyceps sinensis CO18]|uniref:Alpha-1,2 mannosyltransferase KTR1 n=1 Tax=Ophiocordyceps sinensis (strain Co18 / CGMCC 3.14243) TaxID=911162 RepID=T5A3Y8_OPHSC|nr:alpha-1,2 mannosyltransferase KTR1 [Ophiocordyceps sinensis CO18]
MAGGGARYVRYIAIAFVTLTLFYLVSNSKYQAGTIRGDTAQRADTARTDAKQPQTKAESSAHTPSRPSPKDSKDGEISTTKKAPVGNAHEFPLAVSPDDPLWDRNLVGTAPGPRVNATFVTLARNSDVWDIARSIRQVEDRFNRRYNYDWVFLNDKPFDVTFKKVTTSLVSGKAHYGHIPAEHWSFPEWIDQERAKKVREDMAERKIIYGDSVSYRHMCRFESGFFFRQPLMMNYDYYWRVEPSIELFCDVHYDPFRLMAEGGKKYSFVLSLFEYVETIQTLWDSTKKFMTNHPEHVAANNSMGFLSDDGGDTYNLCHFWSNFEIGDLNWLRSQAYLDFFDSLDHDGGFFYERWGDAPVHSIAAGILLNKTEIHFFNDIAYWHAPFLHCTSKYYDVNGLEKPEGYENQQ